MAKAAFQSFHKDIILFVNDRLTKFVSTLLITAIGLLAFRDDASCNISESVRRIFLLLITRLRLSCVLLDLPLLRVKLRLRLLVLHGLRVTMLLWITLTINIRTSHLILLSRWILLLVLTLLVLLLDLLLLWVELLL